MKEDERSIIRKRTQQLVYLELGRDNGGVMLNLSEEGCGFQAISPVKQGKTRFAFQISGRRIAGDAKIEWVDEAGITGGLQFVNLMAEAREQIRRWLEETNAPEEPGEGVVPAAAAPLDAVAQGWRATPSRETSTGSAPPREMRRNASPETRVGVMQQEAPLSPPWVNVPLGNLPVLEEERARFPLLRGDGAFGASRERSVALWRGIAAIATMVAIAALLVFYQRDVGNSLIWMGETITGKTKASAVVPDSKPAEPANPPAEVNAAPEKTAPDAAPQKEPDVARGDEHAPEKADAVIRSAERPESVLEQQPARQKVELPRDEGESVESLWGAVQSGSVAAEMSLAERFVRGDGVVRNCDQARVLFRAAANKGNREARLRLYQLESGGCQ